MTAGSTAVVRPSSPACSTQERMVASANYLGFLLGIFTSSFASPSFRHHFGENSLTSVEHPLNFLNSGSHFLKSESPDLSRIYSDELQKQKEGYSSLKDKAKSALSTEVTKLERITLNLAELKALCGHFTKSRYFQLAEVVSEHAVNNGIKDLAHQIVEFLSLISVAADEDLISRLDCIEKSVLRVLDDPNLNYKERCWALGILSATSDVSINGPSYFQRQMEEDQVSRGALELFLMTDLNLAEEVERVWKNERSQQINSGVTEVLKRVELLSTVSEHMHARAKNEHNTRFDRLYNYLLVACNPPLSKEPLVNAMENIKNVLKSNAFTEWQKKFTHSLCWHLNTYSTLFTQSILSLIEDDDIFRRNFYKIRALKTLREIFEDQDWDTEVKRLLSPFSPQHLDQITPQQVEQSLDSLTMKELDNGSQFLIYEVVNAASAFNPVVLDALVKKLKTFKTVPETLVNMWNQGLLHSARRMLLVKHFLSSGATQASDGLVGRLVQIPWEESRMKDATAEKLLEDVIRDIKACDQWEDQVKYFELMYHIICIKQEVLSKQLDDLIRRPACQCQECIIERRLSAPLLNNKSFQPSMRSKLSHETGDTLLAEKLRLISKHISDNPKNLSGICRVGVSSFAQWLEGIPL
ncbi:hypothetical protein CROQUDRAFT_129897 [Cronartium quercuum f. sp. fusiforme G11]|uniref:Uncharacterized protein n=1 Tax=Cronartium quercuum f. sp. fusiforme G11 TaxID=708437 RepID=A0A9P6NR19_9BASI|nr:hypothetical protein CROQUDRAFT_129897 [Cronartium quercuum f. sp. fusiforme G11]